MEAAVGMLQALTALTGLRLGFSAWPHWDDEEADGEEDNGEEGRQCHTVPSLGNLAVLTELRLNGVCLPRDWRSYRNLQRLSLNGIEHH